MSSENVTVEILSDDDAWAVFDAEARRVFGVDGAEFQRQLNAGAFSEDGPKVERLLMLLPHGGVRP